MVAGFSHSSGCFRICYGQASNGKACMVKFTFNLDGVVYQDGVSNILVSFNAAHDALDQQYGKAEAAAADYERSINDGAEPIEERDEDGHLIYTHSDVLEMHIRDAADACGGR